jgi:hypothetical protein
LQREAGGFIESKILLVKSPSNRPQAGRKSTAQEDGKRREEETSVEGEEEDGAGRRQQFQIGVFTPFSAWACQSWGHWKFDKCAARRKRRSLAVCSKRITIWGIVGRSGIMSNIWFMAGVSRWPVWRGRRRLATWVRETVSSAGLHGSAESRSTCWLTTRDF